MAVPTDRSCDGDSFSKAGVRRPGKEQQAGVNPALACVAFSSSRKKAGLSGGARLLTSDQTITLLRPLPQLRASTAGETADFRGEFCAALADTRLSLDALIGNVRHFCQRCKDCHGRKLIEAFDEEVGILREP